MRSRWVPEPFALAWMLTAVVFVASAAHMLAAGEQDTLARLADAWLSGLALPAGLAFALQMCLVLVTGHAMASAPIARRLIQRLVDVPTGAAAATALVAFTSCLAALIHWGLGAVVGALLAREVGRHAHATGRPVHYPMLGAAAYAGFAVWHGGLSGSAPLKAAEAGIPVSQTLFSPLNFITSLALLVAIPAYLAWRTPREDRCVGWSGEVPLPDADEPQRGYAGSIVGVLGLAMCVWGLAGPRSLDMNSVNLFFFSLGLILHGSLANYTRTVQEGARTAGAIIIQFPLYFGILGMMKASGLVQWLSESMTSLSSAKSFPAVAFLSAGIVNFFVPSGGGQWAVQSELLLRAGNTLGVAPGKTVMALSYGDAWTNMLQPFWALPVLGIMGLRATDIIRGTAEICVLMGVWVVIALTFF